MPPCTWISRKRSIHYCFAITDRYVNPVFSIFPAFEDFNFVMV